MGESKSDVLQGTLDLMVLKTLQFKGPPHGGISETKRRAKFYSLADPDGNR